MTMGASERELISTSALRTRAGARRFALIVGLLFVAGLIVNLLVYRDAPPDVIGVLVTALVLASLTSLPAFAVLRYLDRRERESRLLLLGLLLFGAVVSTGLALVLNEVAFPRFIGYLATHGTTGSALDDPGVREYLAAGFVAPVVEEPAKLLAIVLVLVYLRGEFDGVRDGLVYGALVGLGFNIAETALYVVHGYVLTGQPPYVDQLLTRFVFLGLNGHVLFSAIAGAGIGLARQRVHGALRVVGPVVLLGVAMLAHLVNNLATVLVIGLIFVVAESGSLASGFPPADLWSATAIGVIVTQFPFYLLAAFLLLRSGDWERRVIREGLADEIGGAVTAPEYALIDRDRRFATRSIPGVTAATGRAIVNAQNELAFRKWRVRAGGGQVETDAAVGAWRTEVARLRGPSPAVSALMASKDPSSAS
ncbi:MAG: PrsW family intramembrane metalloprotease [Candidatus Limnocylindrales bacterium]